MRYSILWGILYPILLLQVPDAHAQQTKGGKPSELLQTRAKGRTFAIIVGVSDYQFPKTYKPLNYTDDDARAFYHFLKSEEGGNVPDEHIDTLINQLATKARFNEALANVETQVQEGDLLYIYFSGHGDALSPRLSYLLPYDAPEGKGELGKNHYLLGESLLIHLPLIKATINYLIEEKKVRVILITDACRTNELPGGNQGQRYAHNVIFEENAGEIQLISCSSNEVSLEGSQWGNGRGLFSYHLINGLRGQADSMPTDGKVTLMELYEYTKSRVMRESQYQQIPLYCCGTFNKEVLSLAPTGKFNFTTDDSKKNATPSAPIASRGIDLNSKLSAVGLSSNWKEYLEAIERGNLIENEQSAWFFIQEMERKLPAEDQDLSKLLRIHFSARLLESVNKVIGIYLSAGINNNAYTHAFFEKPYRELLLYREIADPRQYDSINVQVMLYFFNAHSRWKSRNQAVIRQGIDLLDSAMNLNPDAAFLYNIQGLLLTKNKRFKEAERVLRKGIELAPGWIYPIHNLANILVQRNKYDSAESYQRLAISLDTNYQTSYNGMGYIKYMKKEMDSSIWYCKKGLEKDAQDPWLWNQLGYRYFEKGLYSEAIEAFTKSKKYDPNDYTPYEGLLRTYLQLGETDSIGFYIQEMINVDSNSSEGYMAIAYQLRNYNLDSLSNLYFGYAVSSDTLNSDAWFEYGYSFEVLEQVSSAYYCYHKCMMLEPELGRSLNQLALLQWNYGSIDSAIAMTKRAIVLEPENATFYTNLSYYLLKKGEPESVIPLLDSALQLSPEDGFALYCYALACASLDRFKIAMQYLQKATDKGYSITRESLLAEEAFKPYKKRLRFRKILRSIPR